MTEAKKITESITTKSWFKFENINDYIEGLAEMDEMLNKWKSTADEGYDRNFEIITNSDEFKFQMILEVMPHNLES